MLIDGTSIALQYFIITLILNMSKNVANLLLYLCAVFCIALVITIPIFIDSDSSATTGITPWNNVSDTNNSGNSNLGSPDNFSGSGNTVTPNNSGNDTFTFLPRENSESPDKITIKINESFNLVDCFLTNDPKNIISVKTNSDKITVDNTTPYTVVGILGGEAEIIIEVLLNGTLTEYKFYTAVIAEEPPAEDIYELVARKYFYEGYWQIILLKNNEQIDYDTAELEYDMNRAKPDTNYIFEIIGTENITFRLVNLEISCILKP